MGEREKGRSATGFAHSVWNRLSSVLGRKNVQNDVNMRMSTPSVGVIDDRTCVHRNPSHLKCSSKLQASSVAARVFICRFTFNSCLCVGLGTLAYADLTNDSSDS